MCGIIGFAGCTNRPDEALLVAARDELVHRGPDAAGVWTSASGHVAFGHRRLAILDLSPSGAQPMSRDNGRFAITFNGEIYNHAQLREQLRAQGVGFVGRSDTEVLLAAYRHWRHDCVRHLRGMFAFAIYDAETDSVFLARDRAGEKPLFWARHRGGFVFASELKAILRDPAFKPVIDRDGLSFYLAYGYVPGHRSLLSGVQKLSPAHAMSWSLRTGQVSLWRYWEPPQPQPQALCDLQALASELHGLLESAVSEQLQADVPVAVLLSGGVDSSLVTAIAASVSTKPIRTYTVTLPGHSKYDEGAYARIVSDHFRTDHVELPLTPSSLAILDVLARQFDEPVCDSSMIPTYLLARSVSQQCKVVLGGDGGDELFGGYRMYQGAMRQAHLRGQLPSWARSAVSAAARYCLPPGMDGRNGLIGLKGTLEDGVAQTGVMFDEHEIRRLSPWLALHGQHALPRRWRRALVEPQRGTPGAAMAADFLSYLPEDILVKVDRASMLCSLEVRAPLLDHRVAEFAYGRVPNSLRASRSHRKIVLKALARRLLPSGLDLDRKQGFSIPLSEWLTPGVVEQWRHECHEQIATVLCEREVGVRARNVSTRSAERLFALMLLTMWMRHYKVSV